MGKRDHAKGALPFHFVAIPMDVIRSPQWQALSHSARAFAIDLMAQYSGKNNGRLCPGFEAMQRCGWTSRTTLISAKRQLLECPFVVQTRVGHPPRTPEWIGFTWWPLNFETTMDIDPSKFPYLNFASVERIDPNEGRKKPAEKSNSVVQKLDSYRPKTASGCPVSGPMEAPERRLSVQKLDHSP